MSISPIEYAFSQRIGSIEFVAPNEIKIGLDLEAPDGIAADSEVKIDPDRLFGRHLAILGNTGSGKSCSVAGLIQWCLDEAGKECGEKQSPNARFIILDPNGEYSPVFNSKSKHKARVFQVGTNDSSLKVPVWFWNSAEWCSIMQASTKVQRPLLRRALREIKAGRAYTKEQTVEDKKIITTPVFISKVNFNSEGDKNRSNSDKCNKIRIFFESNF